MKVGDAVSVIKQFFTVACQNQSDLFALLDEIAKALSDGTLQPNELFALIQKAASIFGGKLTFQEVLQFINALMEGNVPKALLILFGALKS